MPLRIGFATRTYCGKYTFGSEPSVFCLAVCGAEFDGDVCGERTGIVCAGDPVQPDSDCVCMKTVTGSSVCAAGLDKDCETLLGPTCTTSQDCAAGTVCLQTVKSGVNVCV